MLHDQQAKSTHGLAFWRTQAGQNFAHPASCDEALLSDKPAKLAAKTLQEPLPLQALAFPAQRFYPRSKTSFSALAQHLSRKQLRDALAVEAEKTMSAADEMHRTAFVQSAHAEPLPWIKQNFPMGTVAGTFLHEIFEHIDFQDATDWPLEIRRRFKNDYPVLWFELLNKYQQDFPESDEDQLLAWISAWLAQVLNTPLHQDFQLCELNADAYLAEFPFYLSLSDYVLATQRIHQLYAEYGIEMLDLNPAHSARYLTGSIDLVYFDGQQYHIADYKSNFLGTDQSHYTVPEIQQSMSQASYWLQAGLYLVALHRYLSIKMQDYRIEKHLGGASYLYLRGMNGQTKAGFYHWKPELEFILRLDALLGYFAEDKNIKIS
jgi:exodeoxyribonuclease V beta subunit